MFFKQSGLLFTMVFVLLRFYSQMGMVVQTFFNCATLSQTNYNLLCL